MRHASLLLVAFCLAACAAGPDYVAPETSLPGAFDNADSGTEGDRVAIAGLWSSLDNPDLDRLIDAALSNNTDIRQALATLNETRALSGLQIFSLFPTVTINGSTERVTQSTDDPFSFPGAGIIERYRAGFDASWEIDVFGSLKRQAEQIDYLVEADTATLNAVRIAIIAEVAQSYFTWRGETLRETLIASNVALQGERVDILEATLDAGRGTSLDVERARADERALAASLPLAEASTERALQRLAALTRLPASELRDSLQLPESRESLPALITLGTPDEWLSRRPDVLAAERRLAAASADIGVQKAEYFPKINLTGEFGWIGPDASAIGDANAERWQFAPTISWRILDFGRVRQRVRAAEARFDGALVGYESAWVLALEETENALAQYDATTRRVAALEQAVVSGSRAAELARLRYDAGADNFLSVLDAERTRIDLENELALSRTDRATALAALYKALGGDFARAALPK
ncbi:MAG: efflux transporter outer membrane subunit [Pseudomonadota bacterium]